MKPSTVTNVRYQYYGSSQGIQGKISIKRTLVALENNCIRNVKLIHRRLELDRQINVINRIKFDFFLPAPLLCRLRGKPRKPVLLFLQGRIILSLCLVSPKLQCSCVSERIARLRDRTIDFVPVRVIFNTGLNLYTSMTLTAYGN